MCARAPVGSRFSYLHLDLRAVASLPYRNVTLVQHAARQPLCVLRSLDGASRPTPRRKADSLALPRAIHDSTRSMRRAALEIARRDISMIEELIGKPARGIRPGQWKLPTSSNVDAEFENKVVADDDSPRGFRFSFLMLHAPCLWPRATRRRW